METAWKALYVLPIYLLQCHFGSTKEHKRCMGTNSVFSHREDKLNHIMKLREKYTDCTYVEGNLEITGLADENLDVSFLKDIEIVTGYVLIALNHVPYIPLNNLKIIRGRTLVKEGFALHVAANIDWNRPTVGLQRLGLNSLTEIQQGNVNFTENHRMCYVDTIDWEDILSNGYVAVFNNSVALDVQCSKCHSSCDGRCWGPNETDCQTLTKKICHEKCSLSRCRGPAPEDCCDRECASGCSGPRDTDCIACRHMNNSGICERNCPAKYIYNIKTSTNVENPNFKYHYDGNCVDRCPGNMMVEENGCVKHCRSGYHNDGKGECIPCSKDACNKECFGLGNPGPLVDAASVDANNSHYFEDCNIVNGNIILQAYAFQWDNHTQTPALTTEQISKAFSGVKVITGYLMILSWPKELHDFGIFGNLTTIGGSDLFRGVASLVIQDTNVEEVEPKLDQITSLGFRSLKSIGSGNVYLGHLRNLCYANTMNWTRILKKPTERINFKGGVLMRSTPHNKCEHLVCHKACDENGCWGPGNNNCLACKNYSYNDRCVLQCDLTLGIYASNKTCLPCHKQCQNTCFGKGPDKCNECKHFNHSGVCVSSCPNDMYGDRHKKTCEPCPEICHNQRNGSSGPICTGNAQTLGFGGCTYCFTVMADRHLQKRKCLSRSKPDCPEAHYAYNHAALKGAERICVPCIQGCSNCTGSTENDCLHGVPHGESAVVMSVVILVVFILLVAIVWFLLRHKRQKDEKKRQKSMRALGLESSPEPTTPSGVAPNKAQLRIVKETELRIGKILGTGAFGTVHSGYWIPELSLREKVRVPVAIKVLRDESSQVQSTEILDEAFVMASCEHPNLVRLLGISLSHKIMLITQLMPLGNLLEYVRDNKDNIGSQNLLNWCLQIAKGMRYLADEKHLVHRDLAARNVLVKSPNHVRITDFGLAKLLDVNEDVYRAEGGKMPIKWLALESIQHRIFTQKSDVWSFGVTIWELMTFGKKPYENTPACEVYTLLERGERLSQPTTCTIDVYMLMIKCWTVDSESRPTFKELVDELSRMARDPQRFLVIPNDGILPELPSPTNSEFLRSLKLEELDEEFPLQDAEDYLQPRSPNKTAAVSNGHQFSLKPAPTRSQRRKQPFQSHANGYPSRFVNSSISSNKDSRLDSTITVMTNLTNECGVYPNGCSTPFGPNSAGAGVSTSSNSDVLTPFGKIHYGGYPSHTNSTIDHPQTGLRSSADSSDVFINWPTSDTKDGLDTNGTQTLLQESRPREDSVTLRYCAEPVNARPVNRSNEYLDPMSLPISPFCAGYECARSIPKSPAIENPEYEPTFSPSDGNYGIGITESLSEDMRHESDHKESLPYEMRFPVQISNETNGNVVDYENINNGKLLYSTSCLEEDENGYLMINAESKHTRNSNSENSTSSGYRDSGAPSEGDEGILSIKDLGDSDAVFDGLPIYPHEDYTDSAVNNPNYELLENMTDGGFTPMSDFIPPSHDTEECVNSLGDAFQSIGLNDISYQSKKATNYPHESSLNCPSCEDVKDNIFAAFRSDRHKDMDIKNSWCDETDELFGSPLQRRKDTKENSLLMTDKTHDYLAPRTYSEPDSGVGIEMGIDNILYHRIGSSGGDAADY